MTLIEYITEKMELDIEQVAKHTADWMELQDAVKRLKRAKTDEAKYYEPSDEELIEYVAHKPKPQELLELKL